MRVKKAIFSIFVIHLVFTWALGCGSGQRRDMAVSSDPKVTEAQDKFFNKDVQENVAFRIFASSGNYEIRQYAWEENIVIEADSAGEDAFTKELSAFDKIDLFSDAIFRVELYEDTGNISRIRPVKPARISEINKLIADDITRLKFQFPGETVAPLVFHIHYGIYLQKKASDQEIREELKKNVR